MSLFHILHLKIVAYLYAKSFLQNKLVENVDKIDLETLTKIMPKLRRFFGEPITKQYMELIANAIYDKDVESDWNNTRVCLVDGKKSFNIVCGTGIHNWILYTEDGIVDIVKSVRKQYFDEFITAPVINKRVFGRLLIKYVGNEGADVDTRKASLRQLFQATIDYIQTHDVPGVWENATITVYDSEDNTFKIKSGNGKNTFIVTDIKGNPIIKYTVNNKVKELKETNNQSATNDVGILSRIGGVFGHGK